MTAVLEASHFKLGFFEWWNEASSFHVALNWTQQWLNYENMIIHLVIMVGARLLSIHCLIPMLAWALLATTCIDGVDIISIDDEWIYQAKNF